MNKKILAVVVICSIFGLFGVVFTMLKSHDVVLVGVKDVVVGDAGTQDKEVKNDRTLKRQDMRAMVLGFGSPTEKDLVWIRKDQRNATLDGDYAQVSTEKRGRLKENIWLMQYRQDRLTAAYADGTLRYADFLVGMGQIMQLNIEVDAEILTDAEFESINNVAKSAALNPEGASFLESAYGENSTEWTDDDREFFSTFRDIQERHSEIKHANDVYKIVRKEAIADFLGVMRESFRRSYAANVAHREGRITDMEREKQMNDADRWRVAESNRIFTEKEKAFLFGE